MSLRNVFPLRHVKDKSEKDVSLDEHDLSTIDEVAAKDPGPVLQIGLCIWHQIVTRDLFEVNPAAMARYVDDQDPVLYKKIEQFLGIQAISDFYYANLRVWDERLKEDDECCQICLAHTYPNDIVLADVMFQNPYKPIPREEQRYRYTSHEGLSLMPVFMKRLRKYSVRSDVDRILLTAAAGDLVPLFRKYGFEPDGSPLAKAGLEIGVGIPMQLLLKYE